MFSLRGALGAGLGLGLNAATFIPGAIAWELSSGQASSPAHP